MKEQMLNVLSRVNWKQLQEQKMDLLDIADNLETENGLDHVQCQSERDRVIRETPELRAIHAIINLLDELTDAAYFNGVLQ